MNKNCIPPASQKNGTRPASRANITPPIITHFRSKSFLLLLWGELFDGFPPLFYSFVGAPVLLKPLEMLSFSHLCPFFWGREQIFRKTFPPTTIAAFGASCSFKWWSDFFCLMSYFDSTHWELCDSCCFRFRKLHFCVTRFSTRLSNTGKRSIAISVQEISGSTGGVEC